MRFGIDLDGVLADFGGRVVEIGNTLWPGKFPPGYVPDNWNYEGYLTDEEWKQVWAAIKSTVYFWENEQSLPGVKDLAEGITKEDEVFFITARATTVGQPPSVQSAAWLAHRHLYPRFGYSTVIQVDDLKLKADLFRTLKVKYMLDDYAPTVKALNEITDSNGMPFMRAFVLDQPWNRYMTDLPRVYSVEEYLRTIREIEANRII